jgi:histidinol-phosphate aminotransferase
MKDVKCDIRKMARPSCSGFEPYVAGRPIETIKRELKLKSVIKLASNENPLGPSKKAIAAIKKSASRVYFYPDSNSFLLKNALSRRTLFSVPVQMN